MTLPTLPGAAFASTVVGGIERSADGVVSRLESFTGGVTQRTHPAPKSRLDATVAVLRSAQAYGIAQLLTILLPDSQQAERRVDEFVAVRNFEDLLPALRAYTRSPASGIPTR